MPVRARPTIGGSFRSTHANPDLVRLLSEAFELKLGVWLAMHENLSATPRCRAVFDGLRASLAEYLSR